MWFFLGFVIGFCIAIIIAAIAMNGIQSELGG